MRASKLTAWLTSLTFTASVLASQMAAAATDIATLTKGYSNCESGYRASSMGAYSPTGLTGGTTVIHLFDYFTLPPAIGACSVGVYSWFAASGFSSNPGSSWLTSVTCNGTTKSGATASFLYQNGAALWSWQSIFGLVSLANGANTSCTIIHN